MGWSTANDDRSRAGLELAYSSGVRLFDTADVYGHGHSERLLGELVGRVDRQEIVVTSKVGYFAGTAAHGYAPAHMRRQLEQSLENLRTDHLDIYFFHQPDFGPDDRYLEPAITAMRDFQRQGLVRAIGIRGPHRYAPQRLRAAPDGTKADKSARFEFLFRRIEPQLLAVRDNLLTPSARSEAIFEFARREGCGVLINKSLGQGLLTSQTDRTSTYGPGDHRRRKRWFTAEGREIVAQGFATLRGEIGERADPLRLALWCCLERSESAAVVVGFTSAAQVRANLTAASTRPSDADIATARAVMAEVQMRLDQLGEVFVDELTHI